MKTWKYKIIFKDGSEKIIETEDYNSLVNNLNRRIIDDVKEIFTQNIVTRRYVRCPIPTYIIRE